MTPQLWTDVKNELRRAKVALTAQRFAEATLALSMAYVAAARLDPQPKNHAHGLIAALARQIEAEYQLYLRRRQLEREEALRRQRAKDLSTTEPTAKPKLNELDVKAQLAQTTGNMAILRVTSLNLGHSPDAQRLKEALKNKPVIQTHVPKGLPAGQTNPLKLQLGRHRHSRSLPYPHARKPGIHIGSIS